MKGLKICRSGNIEKLISIRNGETKFGERIQFIDKLEDLAAHPAKFVLLGIREDVGVRANFGKTGTSNAWKSTLKALVNIQLNRYNEPNNLVLLGELDCFEFMEKASYLDESDPNYYAKLGDLVKKIDELLAKLIEKIILFNKIPIIIGGGHNNAYGNIKGATKALKAPVNILNIDAHTDLRKLEHRHSGNGFSYAIEGQYLKKYTVFGLHKNYTPEYIFKEMDVSENLRYSLLEDLLKNPEHLVDNYKKELDIIAQSNFGLELDCDAIANFPSSAKSPSGFTIEQVRQFITMASETGNCNYFHICEAAPTEQDSIQVGKAISYFISDFIRQ